MTDVEDSLFHQRAPPCDEIRILDIALARHTAENQRVTVLGNTGEAVDQVQIDHVVRQHKTHVEHRHERLSAGKQLGVVLLCEKRDSVFDASGVVIGKRRWFHFTPRTCEWSTHHGRSLKCPHRYNV